MKSSDILLPVLADYEVLQQRAEAVEAFRRARAAEFIQPFSRVLSAAFLLSGIDAQWKIESSSLGGWASWQSPPQPYAYARIWAAVQVLAWRDLTPVFEALAVGVPTIPLDGWTSHDDAESYTRTYRFQPIPNWVEVSILATLPGDTDTCRRVIVGYETEDDAPRYRSPRPKYELRCDGEAGDAPSAPAASPDGLDF